MPFSAGRKDRGDIEISFSPLKKGSGLEINVQTSVARLYGERVRKEIVDTLASLDIADGKIDATDDGALPYVIQARVEAAVRLAKEEQK